MENVRPNDVWADTRTLDLINTKKCYQLDGNIGWFHICTWRYCCDRKLAFGTKLIYINDSSWRHSVALTGGKRIYRLNSCVNKHRSVALKLLDLLLTSNNQWCFMYEQTDTKRNQKLHNSKQVFGCKRGVKGKSQYHSFAQPCQRNIVCLVKVNLHAFYTRAIRLRTGVFPFGFRTKTLYALIRSSIVLPSLLIFMFVPCISNNKIPLLKSNQCTCCVNPN
jgi:hypothetical protein